MLDSLKNLGFTYATQVGPVDRHRRPDHPEGEGAARRRKARDEVIKVESQYLEGAITNGERYNKVIAIWSEATEDIANAMFSEMEEIDKEGRQFNPVYIMADSGARGIEAADPSARRHARPDGQAVGRDHRDADHGRTSAKASTVHAVLHLDARRAQGSGRHGAQDRRLGLPDAPSRRRGAGRHHPRARLRHGGRHRGARDRRERARSSSRCATASSAA